MKWHPHSRLVLEVALLELLEERKQEKVVVAEVKEYQNTRLSEREDQKIRISEKQKADMPGDGKIAKIKGHWNDILESVKKKTIFGYVSLHEGEPVEVNGKGKLVVAFRRGYAFHKERLEELKNKQAVEDSLREITGEKIAIECIIGEGKRDASISAKTVAEFFGGRVI